MKAALWVVSAICLAAAVVVFVWPQNAKMAVPPLSGGDNPLLAPVLDQPLARPSAAPELSLAQRLLTGAAPQIAPGLPVLGENLAMEVKYLSETPVVLDRNDLAQGEAVALIWQSLPTSGEIVVELDSSRGGAAARRYLRARWQLTASIGGPAQEFRLTELQSRSSAGDSQARSLRLHLEQGRWQLIGPDAAAHSDDSARAALVAGAMDAVRAIASLHSAFSQAGEAVADSDLALAGAPYHLWPPPADSAAGSGAWLLIAPAREPSPDGRLPAHRATHYPAPQTASGAAAPWNHWRLWLGPQGQWQAAEQLTIQPSLTDDPGHYQRRVLMRW